ncbi:MAG: VWA domain-containing protein [Phycisphaerales bacterium]|nr:MAG: VWA domain-containing protein [Phycisphaerales bacterium]
MPDIYTAAGVLLEHVLDLDGGVSHDSDPRTCEYTHFDLSTEQLGRTSRYNCWGFTFLPRRYWINSDTDVDNILRDNCDPVPDGSVRPGDVIRYRNSSDVTTHTGRVWQTDGAGHATLIRSKWGGWAEYIHPPLGGSPEPVPSSYGTNLAYFRQKAPLLGVADLWLQDSPADSGEQFTETPYWNSPDIVVDAPPYDGVPDSNAAFGETNRVWAVVRNRGDQAVSGVYVRYYWAEPASGAAPSNWHLIAPTSGHPNPAGPFSIGANSSAEAPYVEWSTASTPAHLSLMAIAYINDDPTDSSNPDPLVYPFEMRWDNNIAVCEATMLVQLQNPGINFNDVPEGETTVRAAVFAVRSCRSVTLEIVSGPTGGSFGTPLGTSVTLGTAELFNAPERFARIWLSYTGTNDGDTASGSVRIRCNQTGQEWDIPITANTIARPSVAVVLALDKSNSMNFDSGIPGYKRIDVLHFSAPPFVDVIQEGNAIGMVSFDHDAYDEMPVTGPLGPPGAIDPDRATARGNILSHMPNPEGWTSIGDAVELSHNRLAPVSGYDVKAMIVLTDGHENRPNYIADVAGLINERVYAIGLGTAEQIQPTALTALTNGTGGYLLMTGSLDTDTYFRLAKYYLQILAGVTNHDIVLDPEGYVAPGQTHRVSFDLNETDISTDIILLSPAPYVFKFLVETPAGQIIDPSLAAATPGALFVPGSNVHYYRMSLPVPVGAGAAGSGLWHVLLCINKKYYDRYLRIADAKGLYACTTHQVHGMRYSLSVHAYSNIRMKARILQSGNEPGARLTPRVQLTEYGLPVERRAKIVCDLERPDKTFVTLELSEVEPGVFQTETQAIMSGVYHFNVRAQGTTLRGRPFSRQQVLTGSVWPGGNEPPPKTRDEPDERLCRLLACLLGPRTVSKEMQQRLLKLGLNIDAVRECFKKYCAPGEPRGQLDDGGLKLVETVRMLEPRAKALLKELMDEVEP